MQARAIARPVQRRACRRPCTRRRCRSCKVTHPEARRRSRRSTASTSTRRCLTRRRPRQPADRPRGALDRALSGGALLPVLPGVRADVPAGDADRAVLRRQSPGHAAAGPAQRCRRRVRHLPAQVQPRARVRADRPLAGLVRARADDRQGHRPQAARCATGCCRRSCSAATCSSSDGKGIGGTFQHIPACRSATQLGCVIAFSTFDQPVPANSLFGRTTVQGEQVLCTNPAALGGGAADVDPIFPARRSPADLDRRRRSPPLELTQPTPDDRVVEPAGRLPRAVLVGAAARTCCRSGRWAEPRCRQPEPGSHLGAAPARRQRRARQPRLGGPQRSRCLRRAPAAPLAPASGSTRAAVSATTGRHLARAVSSDHWHRRACGTFTYRDGRCADAGTRARSPSTRERRPSPAGPVDAEHAGRAAARAAGARRAAGPALRAPADGLRARRPTAGSATSGRSEIPTRSEAFVVTCHPDHLALAAQGQARRRAVADRRVAAAPDPRPQLGADLGRRRATCASASCCCRRFTARRSSATWR